MNFNNTIATIAVGMLLSVPAMAGGQGGSNSNAQAGSTAVSEQANGQAITTTNYGSDLGRNVPAIVAPALTTTLSETCMGSTSMGVSAAGFGISLGSTWRDEACVRRLDARELRSFGAGLRPSDAVLFHFAAKERMCEDDKVRAAFERVSRMTKRQDALCQSTADEQVAAAAQRDADAITGTKSVSTYVETQTVEQVATRDATPNEMEWNDATTAN
jgi:hypothetical protein